MGVTRVDDLAENRVVSAVRQARQASAELKGSVQRVSGANIAFVTSQSDNQYDWIGRIDGAFSPFYGRARFVITLTSSRAVVPMVDVALTLYYSADGVTYNEYTFAQGLSDNFTGTSPEIDRTLNLLPGFVNAEGEVRYNFFLIGDLNARVAFKVQVVGIDEVDIAITRVE